MALPLLSAAPASINARVNSFMTTGEETPRRGNQDQRSLDILIEQAYRQIFFHALKADRDPLLESRLRSGQITVREFVRGLLLSNKFRNDFYRCNSNCRIVEHLIGRVLGRPTYGVQEQITWSIVIAERGLPELVDTLLNSEEYLLNFGEDQVPFQRSRLLAGRAIGDLPFNQQAPRYGDYWRQITAQRGRKKPTVKRSMLTSGKKGFCPSSGGKKLLSKKPRRALTTNSKTIDRRMKYQNSFRRARPENVAYFLSAWRK